MKNVIRLNETNKKICGTIDILLSTYDEIELKYKDLGNEFSLIKEKIKAELNQDAEYFTANYKVVISIQPEKTEFKYDMDRILEKYPEIKENELFGQFKTKAPVHTIKSVKKIS